MTNPEPDEASSAVPPTRGRSTAQMITAVALALVVAMLLAACARPDDGGRAGPGESPQADRPARISGRVTASDTGEPLPYVQVVFFDLQGNQVGSPGNTDLSGAYALDLPAGRFHAVANIVNPAHPFGWNGFAPAWTGGRPVKISEAVVEVAPGEQRTIDFELARLRACKGRVTAGGSPTIPSGSWVSVVDAASGGHLVDAQIDGSGAYEVSLPDGEWLLGFSVPGFVQRIALKVSVSGAPVEVPTQNLQPAA